MRPWWAPPEFILLIVVVLLSPAVHGQDYDSTPAQLNPFLAQVIYERLLNVTDSLPSSFTENLGFCIGNMKKEMHSAFNFSNDLTFMNNCLMQNNGDLTKRLCTAAEIMIYFNDFMDNGGKKKFLRPNNNCNLTSWVSGCEPGWACSVGENEKVNLKESKVVPARILNCRPCCEGFFCPLGITCMIRAHCAHSQL